MIEKTSDEVNVTIEFKDGKRKVKATDRTWNEVFDALVQIAYRQKDILSANKVWGESCVKCESILYYGKCSGIIL